MIYPPPDDPYRQPPVEWAQAWAQTFMHHWGERKEEINEELIAAWFRNLICQAYQGGYLQGCKEKENLGDPIHEPPSWPPPVQQNPG